MGWGSISHPTAQTLEVNMKPVYGDQVTVRETAKE